MLLKNESIIVNQFAASPFLCKLCTIQLHLMLRAFAIYMLVYVCVYEFISLVSLFFGLISFVYWVEITFSPFLYFEVEQDNNNNNNRE